MDAQEIALFCANALVALIGSHVATSTLLPCRYLPPSPSVCLGWVSYNILIFRVFCFVYLCEMTSVCWFTAFPVLYYYIIFSGDFVFAGGSFHVIPKKDHAGVGLFTWMIRVRTFLIVTIFEREKNMLTDDSIFFCLFSYYVFFYS